MAYMVRSAEEADLGTLIPMFSTYLETLKAAGLRYDLRHEGVADLLTGRVRSRRTLLAVAEEDGELLGFVCASVSRMSGEYLCEGEGSIGYVDDIYVRPESRGRGVADALEEAAEDWLTQTGVRAVRVLVLFENAAGTAFWRKRGLEPMAAMCYKKLSAV